MKRICDGDGSRQLMFFHICTDGTNNGIVHFDEADYRQAVIISAVCAHRNGVYIVAHCHMSTHSHFVVYCYTVGQAVLFADDFKRDYAKYVANRHGLRKVYNGIDSTPKLITDLRYLKNCISYTLLNPVVAGITKSPEDYKWSSFDAYFNKEKVETIPVSAMTVRKRRSILRTRTDLGHSNLKITPEGNIYLKSMIDYLFVEKLFRTKTEFYKSLALTDSMSEEERYVRSSFSYSDTEIIAEILNLARRKFGKESIVLLSKEEKHSLLLPVRKKTNCTPHKLARILRLPDSEVQVLLGK